MSYSYAVGRRKSSTATVKFFPSGTGQILIKKPNKSEVTLKEYFGGNTHMTEKALMPLDIANDATLKKGDFKITIIGGGLAGQADAIKLGIARALIKHNPALRPTLKPYGTLKRDPRIKERKKFGFLKARKKPKRSKR